MHGSGSAVIRQIAMSGLAAIILHTGDVRSCLAEVKIGRDVTSPIISISAKMVVPPKPTLITPPGPDVGPAVLYIWPGLQSAPGAEHYYPIGNGVLQPVLTWETQPPNCAPGIHPDPKTWWISAQYVNTDRDADYAGYKDCLGGHIMQVDPGDTLLLDISRFGDVWVEGVADVQKQKNVVFQINMLHQAQIYAYFKIEPYGTFQLADVAFQDITITFSDSTSSDCPLTKGPHDDVGLTTVFSRGLKCYIDRITLGQPDVATANLARDPRHRSP